MLGVALFFFGGCAQLSSAAQTQSTSQFAAKKPGRASPKKNLKTRTHGQAAPTPDRIRDIQEALTKAGSYKGEPTGKMDAATLDALKSFQTAQNLPVTGKLDARTLQKLGLGSETAGSAAPKAAAAPTASR